MNRPDHVKCIRSCSQRSWCDRRIFNFEWVFIDIDHAAKVRKGFGRQTACPQCTAEIIKHLTEGQE